MFNPIFKDMISGGRNIQGGAELQNQNDHVSERLKMQVKTNRNGHKIPVIVVTTIRLHPPPHPTSKFHGHSADSVYFGTLSVVHPQTSTLHLDVVKMQQCDWQSNNSPPTDSAEPIIYWALVQRNSVHFRNNYFNTQFVTVVCLRIWLSQFWHKYMLNPWRPVFIFGLDRKVWPLLTRNGTLFYFLDSEGYHPVVNLEESSDSCVCIYIYIYIYIYI